MPETATVHHVVGSAVAGLSSTLLGHPLDTIKTHLQTNPQLRSSVQVVRKIHVTGLFRGMAPPLFNAIVMNTVMFSVFDKVNASYENPFVAGLVSGFATAMISTPTDYLKIQAQLHGSSILDLIGKNPLFQIPLLYRGHLANLAREGVFTMTYMGLYHKLAELERERPTTGLVAARHDNSLVSVALRSSTTGAMAWVISYPIDTIKTIVQSGGDSRSYFSIWKSTPASQLYKGCRTSTFRAILVTSSRMIAYEWVLGVMRQ
jgi:solute carrier family 25 carnitine/acylcarnitine transporter 20/29